MYKIKLNIHFHIDSTYTQETITFINTHFPMVENLHIVTGDKHRMKFVKAYMYSNIYVVNKKKLGDIIAVKKNIKRKKKHTITCFYHYLSNDSIILTVLLGLFKKERNWILWGADLYAYINYDLYSLKTQTIMQENTMKKRSFLQTTFRSMAYNRMFALRKKFLKTLRKIATWNKGDYQLACNHFQISPIHIDFLYNLGLDKNETIEEITYGFKEKIILVGNSGDPSNNHIDIYEVLAQVKGNFKVMSFLTYGDPDYIQNIIKKGIEILGEKFIPITDHMKREDYLIFIEGIDVIIMNHYRQQGMGNIVSFLQKGKKVYMNDFVTTYDYLLANDVKVYSVSELMNVSTIDELLQYDLETKQLNRRNTYHLFNDNSALQRMQRMFE